MDRVKRRRALAGLSCRNYTVDDWEQFQQIQESKAYKIKQEKLKEQYHKKIEDVKKKKGKLTKKDYQDIFDLVYKKPKKIYKPRLKIG